jgi:hypothetical protein
VTSSCEHGNEHSGSIKDGKFIDYLSDHKFLNKDSAPWRWLIVIFQEN